MRPGDPTTPTLDATLEEEDSGLSTEATTGDSPLISMGEACRLLGRSRKTLLTWEREGKLVPAAREGGRRDRRYRARDVMSLVDARLAVVAATVVPGLDAAATRAEVIDHLRTIVLRATNSMERGDWIVGVAAARAVLEFVPPPVAGGAGASPAGALPAWYADADEAPEGHA